MTVTAREAAKARELLKQFRKEQRGTRKPRVQHKPDQKKANRGRERDPGYLAFLRRLPCFACMVEGGECKVTEAAHIRFSDAKWGRTNPGMSVKPADRWASPLGDIHHRSDQHMRSERAFWERLNTDPGELSSELYAAYLAGKDGLPILHDFAGRAR